MDQSFLINVININIININVISITPTFHQSSLTGWWWVKSSATCIELCLPFCIGQVEAKMPNMEITNMQSKYPASQLCVLTSVHVMDMRPDEQHHEESRDIDEVEEEGNEEEQNDQEENEDNDMEEDWLPLDFAFSHQTHLTSAGQADGQLGDRMNPESPIQL